MDKNIPDARIALRYKLVQGQKAQFSTNSHMTIYADSFTQTGAGLIPTGWIV